MTSCEDIIIVVMPYNQWLTLCSRFSVGENASNSSCVLSTSVSRKICHSFILKAWLWLAVWYYLPTRKNTITNQLVRSWLIHMYSFNCIKAEHPLKPLGTHLACLGTQVTKCFSVMWLWNRSLNHYFSASIHISDLGRESSLFGKTLLCMEGQLSLLFAWDIWLTTWAINAVGEEDGRKATI